MNKDIQNTRNDIPIKLPNTSEPIIVRSEESQKRLEPISETFGTKPGSSEEVLNEPNKVPNNSEGKYRTAPTCSADNSQYTITIREAARIFEEAGVPRTERALTNWCNKNVRGITRLDCCYRESQRRYYITPQSIDGVIKEERQKALRLGGQNATLFSYEAEQLSDHVQKEVLSSSEEMQKTSEQDSNSSRTFPNKSEEMWGSNNNFQNDSADYTINSGLGKEVKTEKSKTHESPSNKNNNSQKELQMENYELKVQLEGQKYLIRKFDELVEGERDRHEKEKLAFVDRLTDARHRIGSLEERLLQIEAPKSAVRDVVAEDEIIAHQNSSQKKSYESEFD